MPYILWFICVIKLSIETGHFQVVIIIEHSMEALQILIVEDEEDILDVLKYNLQKAGYRTLEAPNGETARNLIRQASPDLILLRLLSNY